MMLLVLVACVLGPSAVAFALLALTRRCELWLEGDTGQAAPVMNVDTSLAEAGEVAVDGPAFAA